MRSLLGGKRGSADADVEAAGDAEASGRDTCNLMTGGGASVAGVPGAVPASVLGSMDFCFPAFGRRTLLLLWYGSDHAKTPLSANAFHASWICSS